MDDTSLIASIFATVVKYIDSYNGISKIDLYDSHRVKHGATKVNNLVVLREKTNEILRKHKSTVIHEKMDKKQNIFYVYKVDSIAMTQMFILYCIFYYLDNIHSSKRLMIGMDYEFNKNKIALCQLAFFPQRKFKHIFIFDPRELTTQHSTLLIRTVFTSRIYRITHGADSLDLPYIFLELFGNDKIKISQFIEFMIDTRFLCEYVKIFSNYHDKKCSIYDALLYFKVITLDKYNKLKKINEEMGPVQDVHWNISKMTTDHLKYALYDVLYLKEFVSKIFSLAKYKNIGLRQQLKYVPQIDRFICYEKYGVSELDLGDKIKSELDYMNNFIIDSAGRQLTMIGCYNEIISNITIPKNDTKISNLLEINNFKKILALIFKKVIYSIIISKFDVYISKNKLFNKKIIYRDIIDQLLVCKLDKLASLVEYFYVEAKTAIYNLML